MKEEEDIKEEEGIEDIEDIEERMKGDMGEDMGEVEVVEMTNILRNIILPFRLRPQGVLFIKMRYPLRRHITAAQGAMLPRAMSTGKKAMKVRMSE